MEKSFFFLNRRARGCGERKTDYRWRCSQLLPWAAPGGAADGRADAAAGAAPAKKAKWAARVKAKLKPRSSALRQRGLPPDVVRAGWLTKEGDVFTTWRRRFFVLREFGTLEYFKTDAPISAPRSATVPKGTIDVTQYRVRAAAEGAG